MIRGDVCAYQFDVEGTASPRRELIVIVSDISVINSPYRWLQGVPISEADPGHVLATYTYDFGWADALEQKRLYRPWIGRPAGVLTDEELTSLDVRLRAALGL